jgi:tetratricopeptide (TPR) repeat protein
MIMDEQTDTRGNFVPRLLPKLLTVVALVVYLLTLNHWVSLSNLELLARTSGWVWVPQVFNPLSFAVAYPFHWLPVVSIPIALNLFSAVCAALTLGLLARSVAILPHDRTEAQRTREQNAFSFLTIPAAWLPPVFAVLLCGLQLTFWENATNFTGDMVGLLLFAFVIWSLLEYRLDEREGRLFLAAFVYGAGMANDWPMVCFLPVFITAIIWIRGLSFFNPRFLERMALCGLAGMSLYLLLPLVSVISGKMPVTFWEALKFNLSLQFHVVKAFFVNGYVRETLCLLSLSSLAPLLMLAIRWRPTFGDTSPIGTVLAGFMFHLVHAIFLAVCVWVVFDPPFSPREKGFGLTLYYLSALCVGYYSGYFLLVFGKQPVVPLPWRRPSRFIFLNILIVLCVRLLFILAVAGLIYKNAPQIRAENDDTLQHYTSLVGENLPRTGGILLADDSRRLYLQEAALARDGRAKDFVFLDTQSLIWPGYHQFLHKKFPGKWPETVNATETKKLAPLRLITLLVTLGKTNELYYLHPSFGYYFEQFYLEPHGLVYKLKTLPKDTLLPPLPDKNGITVNEAFWLRAGMETLPPIERALAAPKPGAPQSWGEKCLARLQAAQERNLNAVVAGNFYSRSLNFWGVEMQRAGALATAAAHFETAEKLNPDNVVAQINLQFNHSLQTGERVPVDLSKVTTDQFGRYRTWKEVLNANGPFDEPSFCFENGVVWVQGGLFLQAIASFNRVRQLVPDNLDARLCLGQLYDLARLPDRALDAIQDVRGQPGKFSLTDTNEIQLTLIESAAYFQKKEPARAMRLLETEISSFPTNDMLLAATAQFYLVNGLFTNALVVIDRQLKLAPNDPAWLFNRGNVSIQLKAYDDAIAAFTRVLATQMNNPSALFNRALACLDSGRLDAARADYKTLQRSFTNSYRITYGLGEIAWRKHETNEAIKNYEMYLASANTNSDEAKIIVQRLHQLKGKSP